MPKIRAHKTDGLKAADCMAMFLNPADDYSPRTIAAYEAWHLSWQTTDGAAEFAEWERKGKRMRELLAGGAISPHAASERYEKEQ